MREVPRGEGVRAEPLVHHREGACEGGVAQVRVEDVELGSGEQSLVDDGARRKAGDVELARVAVGPAAHLFLRQAPDDVELPLEGVAGEGPAREEALADRRLRHPGEIPERIRVHGDRPPSENRAPFLRCHPFEGVHAPVGKVLVRREKDEARRILTAGRKRESQVAATVAEKGVRDLQQEARPVPRRLVAADRPPVLEVHEDRDGVVHDGVVRRRVEPGDEAHSATVVLVGRVVQPVRFRHAGRVDARKPRAIKGHRTLSLSRESILILCHSYPAVSQEGHGLIRSPDIARRRRIPWRNR